MKAGTVRISWTEGEQDKIFTAIMDLHKQGERNLFKLIQQAQVVLEEHRRRTYIKAKEAIPRYLRGRLVAQGLMEEGPEEGKVDPATARLNAVADERDKALEEAHALRAQAAMLLSENKELHKKLEQVPEPFQIVKDFFSDIAADTIRKSKSISAEANKSQAVAMEKKETAAAPKHDPAPPEAGGLPQHLICGLRADQRQYFETYFENRLRLKFWYAEPGQLPALQSLDDKIKHSAMVWVLMGSAVPHDAVAHVVRHAGEGKFQRVVEYKRDLLRDLMDGWIEKTARA